MGTKITPRRRTRGPLYVVFGLFAASGLLRIGTEAGQVLANPEPPVNISDVPQETDDQCIQSEAVLAALTLREERVTRRETQAAERIQALHIAEDEITRRLAELQDAEATLAATLSLAATASEDDIGRLTAVYENMKPRDAASLFAEMAPAFAAGFLSRMRTDAAAAIMAGLDPETAYSISVIIAGRNAEVPTQ